MIQREHVIMINTNIKESSNSFLKCQPYSTWALGPVFVHVCVMKYSLDLLHFIGKCSNLW